nr:M14 family metallopeptidase [Christiangramia portivictoriae]
MKIRFLIVFLVSISTSFYGQEIQSPSQFLGYELGSQFSRHADVVNYFKYVAEKSALVKYERYGLTHERRPLTYAIISSEENMQNLQSIQQQHFASAGLSNATGTSENAIVWLSYNVHGNEASSTEAAMKTLYELVTGKQELLENTVVILDPCVNPDGRDRYANWYNQVKATPYDTNQFSAEHDEPWPGGRPNHYLFDLNRDWAWATQVETRQRLKVYNQWMPHIHVDFHEQGINDPYYFAPAAEPFHEIITDFQRDFQTRIGKNHAKYFDDNGWLYFTGEQFDLLYPSYGDTYPTYMGAIGMTYEQAGHGRAGLGIQTDEGYILTLKDRIEHHFTTGISTVEMASENAAELVSEFKDFFAEGDSEYKTYALNGEKDKIAALTKLLDRHEIDYSYGKPGTIKGFSYQNSKNGNLETSESTLLVSANQPKSKMIKVLFEPRAKLVDSLTYDITAWSLPYAYGLETVASSKIIDGNSNKAEAFRENTADVNTTAFLSKWNSMDDARFLAELVRNDIKVRFSEQEFRNSGKDFEAGSLIISKSDNAKIEDFQQKVVQIANDMKRELVGTTTGFADKGPDFGSGNIKIINKQKIGLLRGEQVSSLNFGEIWYFFEQDLKYPVIPVEATSLSASVLDNLNVLVMPSGYYSSYLDERRLKMLENWIRGGGKLIAIGDAISAFKGKDNFGIKAKESKKDSVTTEEKLIPYAQREREYVKNMITGSIVETSVDSTHPMAFGYDDTYFSLKLSGESYELLDSGYNVAYIQQPAVVSGFAGSEAQKKLENSLIFGEENIGRGSIIYMVDNPLFRAFWENGKLFFTNALFLTNNRGYDY